MQIKLGPYRGGTNRGNSNLQIRIRLLHPCPKQRTAAPLEQKVRQPKTSAAERVPHTWMPNIFRVVLNLDELDSK